MAAAPSVAPYDDLRESYHLLTTTYYSQVDPQKLIDGARSGLQAELEHLHAHLTLPVQRARSDEAQNIAQIQSQIARAASATHASSTLLTYAAINGMAGSIGDRYTMFFTPEQLKEFNQALDPDKISGIGVLVQADDDSKYIRAAYVVPNTPADKAGIQSGDLLVSVDGVSTKNFTTDDATKLLRGKPGTSVRIQVSRDGAMLPKPFDLNRSEVQPPTVVYKMLPQKIGYIYIMAFGRDTPQEFDLALNRLQQDDVKAYVIDLRNDGGGYVNSALDISARFIKNDPLLTIRERGEHQTTIKSGSDALPSKPMVILVNRYTASASEITAGALQDDGVAILVGEKTFGKGVMQSLSQLRDGAAIKITTAHYLTPANRDINLKGIPPDFAVTENKGARFGELDHDAQLQAAINILSKKLALLKTSD